GGSVGPCGGRGLHQGGGLLRGTESRPAGRRRRPRPEGEGALQGFATRQEPQPATPTIFAVAANPPQRESLRFNRVPERTRSIRPKYATVVPRWSPMTHLCAAGRGR